MERCVYCEVVSLCLNEILKAVNFYRPWTRKEGEYGW